MVTWSIFYILPWTCDHHFHYDIINITGMVIGFSPKKVVKHVHLLPCKWNRIWNISTFTWQKNLFSEFKRSLFLTKRVFSKICIPQSTKRCTVQIAWGVSLKGFSRYGILFVWWSLTFIVFFIFADCSIRKY